MKKSLLALALTSLVLASCSKPENKTDTATAEQHSQAASEVKHDQHQAHDMTHTAENSLDWSGDYQGKLPCADCEGIQTELQLNDDKTYVLKETYLGKGDGKPFETKGSFTFDSKNPSMIVLDQKSEQRKFFIGENTATALDLEGNKIDGSLAEYYVLKKKS